MKYFYLVLTLNFFIPPAYAYVKLPLIFGDSMVLQRGIPIPVWGTADANERITVLFHRQVKTILADKDGKWKVFLAKEPAGGPFILSIKGKNTINFVNVLVGDVWVCSGQSNMEWNVRSSRDAAREIREADYPDIRHITIQKNIAGKPDENIKTSGGWKPANPQNVGDFTAVGYFFARELNKKLKIPIGLIHSSWGGTDIESWISREGLEGSSEFDYLTKTLKYISLDSVRNARKGALRKLISNVQKSIPDQTVINRWKDILYEDGDWPHMRLPDVWENQGLPDFDGLVWFRKDILLTPDQAALPGELHLSTIDDNDITYINGVRVGGINGWDIKRVYKIPAGILRAGKNIIAVRAEDTGGGGGIYGDSADMKLICGNKIISLAGDWKFQIEAGMEGMNSAGPNAYPSILYNGMIYPLIPFAIKGVIWYQGEANAWRAYQYRTAFPLMITDWRRHWREGNFPFYFVQLASFNAGNGNSKNGSAWAELREAQTMTKSLPNTGMAVIIDIGESKDIHPKNKQDVGRRLAAIALHQTYGKQDVFTGPEYTSMRKDGSKIAIYFINKGSGLITTDPSGHVRGFEISGSDQHFYSANAKIEGDHIVAWSPSVAEPVAIRYAWADDAAEASLFNKENFPAAPFRTDKWKGITETNKYNIQH